MRIRIARDGLRIAQIVEALMQRAARRHHKAIGPDRISIGEKDGQRDMRLAVARVQYAGGLVRNQRSFGERTARGNVTFGNRPALASMASSDLRLSGLHATQTRSLGVRFRSGRINVANGLKKNLPLRGRELPRRQWNFCLHCA